MMTPEEIQSELKRNGISQRELVDRSGLSESIVSTLIKQMPVLLQVNGTAPGGRIFP